MGLLLGCSAGGLSEDASLTGQDASVLQTLEFAELPKAPVLANATVELAVRYRDEGGGPIANVQVDFALTSTAAGASLTPSRALTNAEGVARTQLRVGSTSGDLEVRARAGQATDYLPLLVTQANSSRLSVSLSYEGTRAVSSYTVTALPGMGCATALKAGLAGDVSYTFAAQDESVSFELGAGLTAAIVGWARDDTGAKLVRGCKEFTAEPTMDESKTRPALTLVLTDLPIVLDDALELELELNVSGAAQLVAESAQRSVDGVLTPAGGYTMFAEADYYLDAVTAQLASLGDVTGLDALAQRRLSSALSASLAPALATAGAGPKALGQAIGQLVTTRGASLILRSSFQAGVLAPVQDLTVVSLDGTKSLALTALPEGVPPSAKLDARYDAAAAQLRIAALELSLPLGRYGAAVLTGVETESQGTPAALREAAGCASVFGSWWLKSELSGVCDVSVAVAACEGAATQLTTRIKADFASLDTSSAVLQVSGNAQAHDRSEDGQVDDLGPTPLMGTWGSAAINAELRVPSRTAFAL